MEATYDYLDKLPYDSDKPEMPHPNVVDIILPQIQETKQLSWGFLIAIACIFLLSASPIVDHYFGKRLPWSGVLAIKLFVFLLMLSVITLYFPNLL
jgi:hypothetical protein